MDNEDTNLIELFAEIVAGLLLFPVLYIFAVLMFSL